MKYGVALRIALLALVATCWLGCFVPAVTPAHAQGCGPGNPSCIVPTPPTSPCDVSNRAASTAFVAACASGGSGAVSSVFGRTGAVTAQSGDYSFNLISGQFTLSQMPNIGANTVLGNGTASGTTPSALSVPSCSGANQALNWTSASGFGCITVSGGGGGIVTSVFGRTGAVTAQSGDYIFSQIGSTPTTLAGYGIASPLPVAQGGTAATSAGATAANNIGAPAIEPSARTPAKSGSELPIFCRPVFAADDPSKILWVDLWSVDPVGDFECDHNTGLMYGEAALDYAQAQNQPEFISCVIIALGVALRPLGPMELAFIDRVEEVYPDILDQVLTKLTQYIPASH